MPAGAGTAIAGTASLGLGSLLIYAAFRNVPVFGPNGLMSEALRTGKLQPVTAQAAQANVQAQQSYVPWYDRTGPAATTARKTGK